MTPELVVWVLTIPVVAFYGWAMWVSARLWLRIVATVVFVAFWFVAPTFAAMDVVWRYAMPAIVVLVMAVVLVRRSPAARRERASGDSA